MNKKPKYKSNKSPKVLLSLNHKTKVKTKS